MTHLSAAVLDRRALEPYALCKRSLHCLLDCEYSDQFHTCIYIYIYTFKRLPEGNITQVWAEFGMVLDETLLADFGPFRIVHSSYNYD